MSYTLADYARLAESDLKAGIVDVIRANSALLESMSFSTEGALSVEIMRTKYLPTIGTRKIGETFSESKGGVDSVVDRIVNLGYYIDIDKVIMKAKTRIDQKALQIKMGTQAFTLKFNDRFINGAPSDDYDNLTGIRYRLINQLDSGQTIAAGGIDISPDSATLAADQVKLINHIHDLMDLSMEPDWLIMNRELKLRLAAGLRASGMLATTQDSYGRTFETFGEGGPKFLDIGTTDPLDRTAQIILNTELDDGSAVTGGDATSIYGLKIGEEYVNGFDEYPLDVNEVGWLENGVAYRIVLDWTPGYYVVHPFSLGRIVGVVAK